MEEAGYRGSDGWYYPYQRDPPFVEDPEVDDAHYEAALENHRQRCEEALKYDNDVKGRNFELVEFVSFEIVYMGPYLRWHFNFKAKNKARADDDDDSLKLFYADFCETHRFGHRLISVTQCEILDPSGPVGNCVSCGDAVLHPTNFDENQEILPFWVPADQFPDRVFELPQPSQTTTRARE